MLIIFKIIKNIILSCIIVLIIIEYRFEKATNHLKIIIKVNKTHQ